MTEVLVIGYGNELRGDDAIGPRIAARVADWKLPHVRSLALHQLTPELAEPIAAARKVIFVDAAAQGGDQVQCAGLTPATQPETLGHTSHPRSLLALARALFGRCPEAWLVSVPSAQFEFGAALSPQAEAGIVEALRIIRQLGETKYPNS